MSLVKDMKHIQEVATLQARLDELTAENTELRADYHHACQTIATMHAAAMGEFGLGPIRGVVEDIVDLRTDLLCTRMDLQYARTTIADLKQELTELQNTSTYDEEGSQAAAMALYEQYVSFASQPTLTILKDRKTPPGGRELKYEPQFVGLIDLIVQNQRTDEEFKAHEGFED